MKRIKIPIIRESKEQDIVYCYHATSIGLASKILSEGYLYSIDSLIKKNPEMFQHIIKNYASRVSYNILKKYPKGLSDLEKAEIYWRLKSKNMYDFLEKEYDNYGVFLTLFDYALLNESVDCYFKIPISMLDENYSVLFINVGSQYYHVNEENCRKMLNRFPIEKVQNIMNSNKKLKHIGLPQIVSYKPVKINKHMLMYI